MQRYAFFSYWPNLDKHRNFLKGIMVFNYKFIKQNINYNYGKDFHNI